MDYISREKLKQAMYHEVFETDTELQKWESGCWIRYKLFENVIDALPAADVEERKVGKWKKISPAGIYECPICGRDVMTSDIECYRFCHHCGAKMEGNE